MEDSPVTIRKDANGDVLYVVAGPSLTDETKTVNYALRKQVLADYAERGQFSMLAQFATLVADGLILSKHCFRGLRRNLYCDDNENGHELKFALTRRPAYDYVWAGGAAGKPDRRDAPPDEVFVILISKNVHTESYPDIEGWIDRWSWVAEDSGPLREAPQGWVERYADKIWSVVKTF